VGDGYAAVAAANPYGFVALRSRGVKYYWAGLGLVVLAAMYAMPIAAVFRQAAIPAPSKPLPNLAIPNVAIPLLRVPKLHALAPLPPLAKAHAPAPTAAQQTHAPAATKPVRRRVPVISDTHTQVAPTAKASSSKPTDPFASAPVVSDEVGTPVALPSTTAAAPTTAGTTQTTPPDTANAAPTTAPTTPAAPATQYPDTQAPTTDAAVTTSVQAPHTLLI
jgi:hypothetical protein